MSYTKPRTRRCRSGMCTNAALPAMLECARCRVASAQQRQSAYRGEVKLVHPIGGITLPLAGTPEGTPIQSGGA